MGHVLLSLRFRLAMVTVVAFAFVALTVTAAYGAVASGRITDSVSGEVVPSSGVDVYSYDDVNGFWSANWWAEADENGDYSLDLNARSYRFGFYGYGHAYEYYDGAAGVSSVDTAQSVVLDDATVRDDLDAAMDPLPVSISGRVTAADTGLGLGSVDVNAQRYNADSDTWDWMMTAYTDANGDYVFFGLDDGLWRVEFADYSNGYYGTTSDGWGVPVTDVNAVLTSTPFISGLVTDEFEGAPLSGIYVDVYQGDSESGWNYSWSTNTDENGVYAARWLEDGTDYVLAFTDEWGTYAGEFYSDASDTLSATPVTASASGTYEINAALLPIEATFGTVSGRVVDDATGKAAEGVQVDFYDTDRNYTGYTVWTDWFGRYSIGLPPGDYLVGFQDWGNRFLPEFYDNTLAISLGNPITVTTGNETAGVDAALESNYGSVSGTVTADDGSATPLQDVEVAAYVSDGEGGYTVAVYAYTDENGYYELPMLGANSYLIQFDHWTGYYRQQFWNGQATLESADPVTVGAGDSLSGYDAALALADPGITGTVRAEGTSTPIEGVGVQALVYNADDDIWYPVADGYTDSNGEYALYGLDAGEYAVMFMDWNFEWQAQYYNGQDSIDDSDPVTFNGATTTTGVDAYLAQGGMGTIAGTITAQDSGDPIPFASADAYSFDGYEWCVWDWYTADAVGMYEMTLPPLTFRLDFYDNNGDYLEEYYDNASNIWAAQDVEVEPGSTRTIDVGLAKSASISGTITGADGPLRDIDVSVYYDHPDAGEYVDWTMAWTETDGTYHVNGLPAGDYKLRFSDSARGRAQTEWFSDKADLDSADAVSAGAGEDVAGINATLETAGRITGTVKNPDGEPLSDIGVEVYADDGEGGMLWMSSGWTDVNGLYVAGGLPAGDYYIYFYDAYYSGERYAAEYHEDSASPEGATSVAVVVGEDTQVDAELAEAGGWGYIAGTIRDSVSDYPIGGAWVELLAPAESGWEMLAETVSDDSGAYRFEWVPEGYYLVRASVWSGAYEEGYDYHASDPESAGQLYLGPAAGGLDEITVMLDPVAEAGHISGTVRTGAAAPIAGAHVTFFQRYEDEDEGEYWADVATTVTDPDGSFTAALCAGDYKIRYSASGYATEWFDDAVDESDANVVPLSEGEDLVKDAYLGAGGSITGTIGGLTPGANASAELQRLVDTEYVFVDWVPAATDGTYSFGGLPAGTYRVRFAAWNADYDYARQYWNGAVTPDDAAPIVLTVGEDRTDIDAEMVPGAFVCGTLSADDGQLAWEIDVSLWRLNGAAWELYDTGTAWDAEYAFGELPAGTYRVQFSDPTAHYADIFYGDAAAIGGATNIVVAEGGSGTADQRLDALPPVATDDAKTSYIGSAAIHLTATDAGIGVQEIRYSLDGGATTKTVLGASATVSASTPGAYTLRYAAVDKLGHVSPSVTRAFSVVSETTTYKPIAGDNRYLTSIEVSKKAFTTADTVVLATGENWPDALGGAALAGAYDGPILLVKTNELPGPVLTEIARLKAKNVFILGGTGAVSGSVESALKGAGYTVRRLGGTNRYATSRLIASEVAKKMGDSLEGWGFIATGNNFPDALAGSPISAAKAWPIYLVGSSVSNSEMNAVKANGVDHLVLLGGTGAVNESVERSLRGAFGTSNVVRKSGGNRYQTALRVAELGVSKGLTWDKMALATGDNFPDALAGGVLQGKSDSVMLLTPGNKLDGDVEGLLKAQKTKIHEVRYLGGLQSIQQSVRSAVAAILK